MNIESYSDLEREIERYENEIEHLNDVQRQLNESNLDFDERNREQQKITNHMNNTNETLNNLLEIQRAYNTFVNNLGEIRQIDVEHASNKEEAQTRLGTLQNEIIEARKILPESLQREIRENIIANQGDLNNTSREAEAPSNVDYRSEYENLANEFYEILGSRDLGEIGLNDYDEIEKKYNEVSEKRDKLFEAVNDLKGQISEEELNDLLGMDSGLKEKVDKEIEEFNIIKETKKAFKEDKEKEIQEKQDEINFLKQQKNDIENTIKLSGNKLSSSTIEKYRGIEKDLDEALNKSEKKLEELNDELNIIINGGKIEMHNQTQTSSQTHTPLQPQTPNPIQTSSQTQSQSQNQTQSQSQTQNQTQNQTQRQTPPVRPNGNRPVNPATNGPQRPTSPQPQQPTTLDNLVKSGKLPKNLSRGSLLRICNELNIPISDVNTVLTSEQVERLSNDHEIQVALLNQKIADRNQRKISEYDKLIAKYESIMKDKMDGKEFSDGYIDKVANLLDKSKSERQIYVDRNKEITAFDHSEVLGAVSELREGGLDSKATNINDKLRAQYEKLDTLRDDRSKAKSKFKQKRDDSRIKKTLAKIEKLKGKKSVISDKQTQIVNKNAEKYISKMTKKIKKHLTRQGRVEMSVDRINDLNERIERNNHERQSVAFDRQTETRLLDRIGMAFEDKILQAQAATLEGQRNMEDFVGRLGR